jgi:uncharacterized protein YjlB
MYQVRHYIFSDDGVFPNSKWPLLIYSNFFDDGHDAKTIEQTFAAHDWSNSWRNGIYNYQHYHSITHEVLGIFQGNAKVLFGGLQGIEMELNPGDVVIIPAGVAHKRMNGSKDFGCVGAYPEGMAYDMNYGKEGERPKADENISKVGLPPTDPVKGKHGILFDFWKR